MTNNSNPSAIYDELVAAIVKAVPEIAKGYPGTHMTGGVPFRLFRPITIEIVMRAAPKKLFACADSERTIELFPAKDLLAGSKSKNVYALWLPNLPLSQQSQDTILFLHKLLV